MAEHEDGFYWVRVRDGDGDEWTVAEFRHGLDWYVSGQGDRVEPGDFLEVDWRRIVREPSETDVPLGSVVAMNRQRGDGRVRGEVIEVDLSLNSFPYKVWYGPGPDDWVRLGPDEFTLIEKPRAKED